MEPCNLSNRGVLLSCRVPAPHRRRGSLRAQIRINKRYQACRRRRPSTLTSKTTVADAFEGRVYAEFAERIDHQDETEQCYISMENGQKKKCGSLAEFDSLARPYMGIK